MAIHYLLTRLLAACLSVLQVGLLAIFFTRPLYAVFDTNNTGARPFALGGAFLAISDDVYATNPAGFGQINENQLCATHNSIYETGDLADNSVSAVFHRGAGSVSVGARRFGITGEYGEETVNLGYGHRTGNVYLGFNYKVMSAAAPGYSRTGDSLYKGGVSAVSFDAGIIARVMPELKLALAGFNLNSPVFKMLSSSPEGEKAGPDFGAGAAYSVQDNMIFSLEYRLSAGGLNAGTEISINDVLFLRLGSNKNNFTGGAGIRFKTRGAATAQVDFGFASHRILGMSYQVSTLFRWGND